MLVCRDLLSMSLYWSVGGTKPFVRKFVAHSPSVRQALYNSITNCLTLGCVVQQLNRRLREEQDEEYQRSLLADQEREKQRAAERAAQEEQQRAAQQAEEAERYHSLFSHPDVVTVSVNQHRWCLACSPPICP